ncbi:MAG: 1-(5-phosphoribosyl)-5-amino-4-imidazole-carboxylate carboxylase [Clostridia bacterium BRH_c25]|nr:MAG: 1-(5-phosphoribosyl)-5-amino-4-imidazole-carboxylate carboxylase [Clostridia bacterium BRH_c25]
MDERFLKQLLVSVKNGELEADEAVKQLKKLPYEDMGYVKIDHHRKLRTGSGEVVYCAGKTPEQIVAIYEKLLEYNGKAMGTRADPAAYEAVKARIPQAKYYEQARIITVGDSEEHQLAGKIVIATGGTSDIPVAEEAAVTAEFFGSNVIRLYDVGVAGIHRLLMNTDKLENANVIVAVAGMEGALASVVAGLADCPVIAVPTSVGYGANFGGLSALLTMLNSCANGISVVNIDNGFGAGFLANMINKR